MATGAHLLQHERRTRFRPLEGKWRPCFASTFPPPRPRLPPAVAENQPLQHVKNRMTSPLTFSGYAALLRDFIRAHSASRTVTGLETGSNAGNVSPDAAPEGAGGEGWGEADACSFNQLALSLFALQFDHNPPYRRFCESRRVAPDTIEHWSRIPAIPTAAFKEFELTSLPAGHRAFVFHSSGTTGRRPGRHFHDAESLSLYEASLLPWFQIHLLPEFPPTNPQSEIGNSQSGIRFLSLTPPPELAPHSSLGHMFAAAIANSEPGIRYLPASSVMMGLGNSISTGPLTPCAKPSPPIAILPCWAPPLISFRCLTLWCKPA